MLISALVVGASAGKLKAFENKNLLFKPFLSYCAQAGAWRQKAPVHTEDFCEQSMPSPPSELAP